MPTTVHSEPLNPGTSRQVYQAGDFDELVTLIHTGDASGDLRLAVNTSGDLNENVGIIPRSVAVTMRLEAKAVITAMSTAGDDRRLTVIATPMFELGWFKSMEEELFNMRCLITQMLSEMIVARERGEEALAFAKGPEFYDQWVRDRVKTGIPDSTALLAAETTRRTTVTQLPSSPLVSTPKSAPAPTTVTSLPSAPLVPSFKGFGRIRGR